MIDRVFREVERWASMRDLRLTSAAYGYAMAWYLIDEA
jgi:hypothetical protein